MPAVAAGVDDVALAGDPDLRQTRRQIVRVADLVLARIVGTVLLRLRFAHGVVVRHVQGEAADPIRTARHRDHLLEQRHRLGEVLGPAQPARV